MTNSSVEQMRKDQKNEFKEIIRVAVIGIVLLLVYFSVLFNFDL